MIQLTGGNVILVVCYTCWIIIVLNCYVCIEYICICYTYVLNYKRCASCGRLVGEFYYRY